MKTYNELVEENATLAAHVERIITEWNSGDDLFSDEWISRMGDIVEDAPETSLARLKAQWDQDELQPIWETLIKVADMLRIDPEKARKAGGKPSAVYAESLARQKRLWQAEAVET